MDELIDFATSAARKTFEDAAWRLAQAEAAVYAAEYAVNSTKDGHDREAYATARYEYIIGKDAREAEWAAARKWFDQVKEKTK